MDPILVGGLAFTWVVGMMAGALIVAGAIEMIAGRAVINLTRVTWTRDEATVLGLSRVLQGLSLGSWGFIGAMLSARLMPLPGVGTPWAIFTSAPLWLVFIAALGLQVLVMWHNKKEWPFDREKRA
ncbi:MAG TPA: hypothetical protein VKE27_06165 [Candidatus Dormibacteraeota bacterium]|nr:hypothetical protein [Candidatus Dormibacteraeota bacterium]